MLWHIHYLQHGLARPLPRMLTICICLAISNPRTGNDFTFSPKSSWVVPVHGRYLKLEVRFHDGFPGYEAERSNSKSKVNRLVDCGNQKWFHTTVFRSWLSTVESVTARKVCLNLSYFGIAAKKKVYNLRSLGAFAKLRNVTVSFLMSVSPHWITRFPLDGFSWSFILQYFSQFCQEIQV